MLVFFNSVTQRVYGLVSDSVLNLAYFYNKFRGR